MTGNTTKSKLFQLLKGWQAPMARTETVAPPRTQKPQANRPATSPNRAKPAASRRTQQQAQVRSFQMPFEAQNIYMILGGVAVIALGYLLMRFAPTMSFWGLTAGPI